MGLFIRYVVLSPGHAPVFGTLAKYFLHGKGTPCRQRVLYTSELRGWWAVRHVVGCVRACECVHVRECIAYRPVCMHVYVAHTYMCAQTR